MTNGNDGPGTSRTASSFGDDVGAIASIVSDAHAAGSKLDDRP
jgi:hypothetical protein